MKIIKQIILGVIICAALLQDMFLVDVYAAGASCSRTPKNGSCSSYGAEYQKEDQGGKDCCVCEKPLVGNSCSAYGDGYSPTRDKCCVSCMTCKSAPYEFQVYTNFQVEMIQVLRKAVRQKEEEKGYKNVGLFSAGILNIPMNMLKAWGDALKRSASNLVDGFNSAKMGAILMFSMSKELVGKDVGGGFLILFRNEPFVRDWGTLLDIDNSLHDAMWDLGMKGLWDDDIVGDISKDMIKLQAKYGVSKGNKNALFRSFNTKGSYKYKDLVSMLLRLNGIMKTFISIDNGSVNTKVISRGGISAGFNPVLMQDMVTHYDCAKGVSACSSAFKNLSKNTKVRKQISEGLTESMGIINKANDKLWKSMLSMGSSVKDTFSNKEKNDELGLTDKQISILRTSYGIDTTKLSKEQGIGLEKTIFAVTHPGQMINNINLKSQDYNSRQKVLNEKNKMSSRQKARQDRKALEAALKSGTVAAESLLSGERLTTMAATGMMQKLKEGLNDVLIQKQDDKNLFMIYSNLAITKYFVEIGSYIHQILEKRIGDKSGRGLVKTLGDTCEAQCSNNGNTNCFAK